MLVNRRVTPSILLEFLNDSLITIYIPYHEIRLSHFESFLNYGLLQVRVRCVMHVKIVQICGIHITLERLQIRRFSHFGVTNFR